MSCSNWTGIYARSEDKNDDHAVYPCTCKRNMILTISDTAIVFCCRYLRHTQVQLARQTTEFERYELNFVRFWNLRLVPTCSLQFLKECVVWQ
jgi:hypothetical protein